MTSPVHVPLQTARQFLLQRHGLSGPSRFVGGQGIMEYVAMVDSIQYDPIDICGRNTDLVLQSRVPGYKKQMLWNLLYRERKLVDYFDKELCVFAAAEWPCFARTRAQLGADVRSHGQIASAIPQVLDALRARGPSTSKELDDGNSVHWYWGKTRLARATLEHLYYAGRVGIYEKRGGNKVYDLIEHLLPNELLSAPDPFADTASFQRFLLRRRIGAIGLLWNRASPAWLGFGAFKTAERNAAFDALIKTGDIAPIKVEGLRDLFYVKADELETLVVAQEEGPRCEWLAPLDNLLWDRKLIEALFSFSYTWEVYTPPQKRRYGHYVLPVLYGDRFIGRVEPVVDRKTGGLTVRNIWPEDGIDLDAAPYKRAVEECVHRFGRFHAESAQG